MNEPITAGTQELVPVPKPKKPYTKKSAYWAAKEAKARASGDPKRSLDKKPPLDLRQPGSGQFAPGNHQGGRRKGSLGRLSAALLEQYEEVAVKLGAAGNPWVLCASIIADEKQTTKTRLEAARILTSVLTPKMIEISSGDEPSQTEIDLTAAAQRSPALRALLSRFLQERAAQATEMITVSQELSDSARVESLRRSQASGDPGALVQLPASQLPPAQLPAATAVATEPAPRPRQPHGWTGKTDYFED